MISAIITAFREPETIVAALEAILPQLQHEDELIVICPDRPTAQAAARFPRVQVLRDPGNGKPAALNLGLNEARGEIIVLTDGDVVILPSALKALLSPFNDPQVGAVSGHPISVSDRNTMLGYWSHLLTDAGAHQERIERDARSQFFVCTGYLYAIRSGIITHVPEDSLSDDAVISHLIAGEGFAIRYAPDACVEVKYPTTYHDWLKQKVRSAGGYTQSVIASSPLQMRSFRHEVLGGTLRALRYPRSLKELLWTFVLFAARLHLWLLIFWRVRIRRQSLTQLWRRVETTK